ncbi:MAG: Maf family nucleotide pyrophosphatase [Fluviibacter sp.]|jgi:septum formation protein
MTLLPTRTPGQPPVKHLILGSSSVYRRALLDRLHLTYSVISPDIDETALPGEHPAATARRLARAKAQAVAQQLPADQKGALIIGSDQVAVIGDRIFGKPGSHEKAVAQLQILSGQTVVFETALCLYDVLNDTAHEELVSTEVEFRELSLEEIEAYLQREPAYDCAGSAKSEGLGIALLDRLSGDDPTALIGLPLIALCRLLRHAGFNPLLTV